MTPTDIRAATVYGCGCEPCWVLRLAASAMEEDADVLLAISRVDMPELIEALSATALKVVGF